MSIKIIIVADSSFQSTKHRTLAPLLEISKKNMAIHIRTTLIIASTVE
jgi:hypothetical protein